LGFLGSNQTWCCVAYRSSDDPLRTVVSRYEQIQGLWALPLISPHGDANFSADLKRKGCWRFSKKEMDCFVVYGVLNTRQLHNKNSKNKNLHVDSERDNNNN
jgi:hypothetical protein